MKNIQIKTHKTTITIKDYLLELYAERYFESSYKDSKKAINKKIRDLISKSVTDKDSKYLSQNITMLLTKLVAQPRPQEQ